MKFATLVLAAAFGAAASFPLTAHHNCAAGADVCPEEIGDALGNHEDAFDSLLDDMGEPTTGGDPVDVVGDLAREEGDNAADSNAANIPDPQDP